MSDFLLDTCAVIWIANNDDLREPALSELPEACARGSQLFVSPMTAWEIAMLVAKERIVLTSSPDIWFEQFCKRPVVAVAGISASVLVASTILPGAPPSDPVDRILAATAREFGYTLVTRDELLLEYGTKGHMKVIGC